MERLQMTSETRLAHLLSHTSGLERGLFTRERALEAVGEAYLSQCFARANAEVADGKVRMV